MYNINDYKIYTAGRELMGEEYEVYLDVYPHEAPWSRALTSFMMKYYRHLVLTV